MKKFSNFREKVQRFIAVATNNRENGLRIRLFDLHKDVLRQILLLCNARTICKFAQVSKAGNSMSCDEALWEDMVIRDFYFTNRSARDLKSTLNGTYKLVYRCCKEYRLTDIQIIASCEIKNPGFRDNYLRGRSWFLDEYQKDVLKLFIDDQNMEFDLAIAEMEGLNEDQLSAVVNGLSRDDVFGLSRHQMYILSRFNTPNSLIANRVRELKFYDYAEGSAYVHIFDDFIDKCGMTAEAAMDALDKMDEQQRTDVISGGDADEISEGLSKDEVVGLSQHQISALVEFRGRGLTADYLRLCPWFCSNAHVSALRLPNR